MLAKASLPSDMPCRMCICLAAQMTIALAAIVCIIMYCTAVRESSPAILYCTCH